MTLRLPASFAALLFVSCAGCSNHERAPVAAAQWFVMGPSESVIAIGAPDRTLRLIDGTTGAELGTSNVHSEAVDVVFRESGALYVFQGRRRDADLVVVTKFENGAFESAGEFPLNKDRELVPYLLGGGNDGVFAGEKLPLLERDASGPRALWRYDFATQQLEPVPLSEPFTGVGLVSVSPTGDLFAWVRASADGKRSDLEVFDFTGAKRASHSGAEPIAPYWLEGVDALLFVRRGGGIARLSVQGSVVQTICDGTLTFGIARSSVAPRVQGRPSVNIEKYSFKGFAQLFEVAPFPVEDSGEKRITSDDIDNYGSSWSGDRRFFSYRQCRLEKTSDPVLETLVVVDTELRYQATLLGEREAPRASLRVGPTFAPQTHHVYFIAGDRLMRVDLDHH